MQLLLTSIGLQSKKVSDFFISILPFKSANCSLLMIALIEDDDLKSYLDDSKNKLKKLGFKNIDFFDLKNKKFSNTKNYDVIFLHGGATFSILKRMRITGIDKYIKQEAQRGAIYLGISAGSIIAGPNIAIADWGSEADTNDVGLKDLTGLGLTNIAVWPHFRKPLQKEVDDFRQTVDYPVVELTDKQALYIKNDIQKIIG